MPSHTKDSNWFIDRLMELAASRNLDSIGIRTVMVRVQEWVHYASCVFVPSNLLNRDEAQPPRMIYPQVALLSKTVSLQSIHSYDDIFAALQTWDNFGTCSITYPTSLAADIDYWFLGSRNESSELPAWMFTAGRQPEVIPPHEPLLAPHLPSYQDTIEAASVWLCDPSIISNYYPAYTYRFLFSTSSAYIKDMVLEEDHGLRIEITRLFGQDDLELQLKTTKTDGSDTRKTLPVTEKELMIPLPQNTVELRAYLINQDGELQDFFEETPHRSTWKTRVLKSQLEPSNETKVIEMSKGEGILELEEGTPQNVFIVHGHDEDTREQVASFIREIGCTPIVLHERPNLGRTIIEKLEQEASSIGFAIVLLTPDDVGTLADTSTDPMPRARQNVILELGYFVAKLGRDRVCPLYKDNVELPSDILGVLYVPFDAEGEWKSQLIREMEAANMVVNKPPILPNEE